jgi:dUTP pyrophosphatase
MGTATANNPSSILIPIRVDTSAEGLPLPKTMTAGAAGVDLYASASERIPARQWRKVSTGIAIAIPSGFEGQVRPRSGLAMQYGVTVLNAPGTIDSDYRGLIDVILINHGSSDFQIERGDRIAQLVIVPVVRASFVQDADLKETERSNGGFGHTGR